MRTAWRWWSMLLVTGLLLTACGGAARGSATTGGYGTEVKVGGGAYRLITVDDLSVMLENKDFPLINVHIPYEGEIEPTNSHIPYNEIEKHLDELPADKSARIVLYCRSGPMSANAAKTLVGLGYTGIHDVQGGMRAWKDSGREIVFKPQ